MVSFSGVSALRRSHDAFLLSAKTAAGAWLPTKGGLVCHQPALVGVVVVCVVLLPGAVQRMKAMEEGGEMKITSGWGCERRAVCVQVLQVVWRRLPLPGKSRHCVCCCGIPR